MIEELDEFAEEHNFPKLRLNSNSRNVLCFYIGDYTGTYPNYENHYLNLINRLREEIETKGKIYWGMELDEFNQGRLLKEIYQKIIQQRFGYGLLVYPKIENEDPDLIFIDHLISSILPEERFKIMFPGNELKSNANTLVKEYPQVLEKVVSL